MLNSRNLQLITKWIIRHIQASTKTTLISNVQYLQLDITKIKSDETKKKIKEKRKRKLKHFLEQAILISAKKKITLA